MSSNFSFQGAQLHNPFSAAPMAGRAQVLQEVLGAVGLDRGAGFTGLVPGAGWVASSLCTPVCGTLPGGADAAPALA